MANDDDFEWYERNPKGKTFGEYITDKYPLWDRGPHDKYMKKYRQTLVDQGRISEDKPLSLSPAELEERKRMDAYQGRGQIPRRNGGEVLNSFKSTARFDQPKFKNGRRTKG